MRCSWRTARKTPGVSSRVQTSAARVGARALTGARPLRAIQSPSAMPGIIDFTTLRSLYRYRSCPETLGFLCEWHGLMVSPEEKRGELAKGIPCFLGQEVRWLARNLDPPILPVCISMYNIYIYIYFEPQSSSLTTQHFPFNTSQAENMPFEGWHVGIEYRIGTLHPWAQRCNGTSATHGPEDLVL